MKNPMLKNAINELIITLCWPGKMFDGLLAVYGAIFKQFFMIGTILAIVEVDYVFRNFGTSEHLLSVP